jgi:hypothetical protein
MAWARLDDGFHDHRKIIDLLEDEHGCAAIGLWTVCLTWAHRHTRQRGKQHGFVPHNIPRRLTGQGWLPLAELLVKHQLWELVDGGWQIHDFTDYGCPSDDLRTKRAEAGRKGMASRWGSHVSAGDDNNLLEEANNSITGGSNKAITPGGLGIGSKRSSGSSKAEVSSSGEKKPRSSKRATRLPDDFTVTPEMVAWARKECPHVDGKLATTMFVDYWGSKGRDATKTDWTATWRNWLRRAEQDAARPSNGYRKPEQQAPGYYDDKIVKW